MKAFISIDLEGIPHIVSREHLTLNGKLYAEARQLTTDCLLMVLESLRELGVEDFVVADSHGPMVNVLPEKLPEHVELVRGTPRTHAMVTGAKGCNAAFFIGYHARPGVSCAVFDHVYNSATIQAIRVNGESASEFLLNASVLGEMGIPVVMVAGDRALLEEDVKKYAPWAARAILKDSYSRYAAISPSWDRVGAILKNACQEAVNSFKQRQAQLVKFIRPIDTQITFTSTAYADIAAHLPGSTRVDGMTVGYQAQSMAEGYRVIQLLMMVAQGVRSITET